MGRRARQVRDRAQDLVGDLDQLAMALAAGGMPAEGALSMLAELDGRMAKLRHELEDKELAGWVVLPKKPRVDGAAPENYGELLRSRALPQVEVEAREAAGRRQGGLKRVKEEAEALDRAVARGLEEVPKPVARPKLKSEGSKSGETEQPSTERLREALAKGAAH